MKQHSPNKRALPLIKEKFRQSASDEVGYQLIDAETVLERKEVPVSQYFRTSQVVISVFDFKKYEVKTTALTLVGSGSSRTEHVDVHTVSFSELEGKQAIIDAHRALKELGGAPPNLESFSEMVLETKQRLQAPRTATFSKT